jgi:carbonic anhydrase
MSLRGEIARANERYADAFVIGRLPAPPRRRFAVLTCMDARLDPAKFLGFSEGDAHVIRNAGGLATDDAIRSLVISHWLHRTRVVLVIAHEGCGLLEFTNQSLRQRLPPNARDVDFLPFPDLEQSVRDSLVRIRESPLLPDEFEAIGYVYDVATGRLREVT